MMEQMIWVLSQPIVGTVIGILGIVIGAVLAVVFYFKAKVVSKPCYSIENTNLIDLSYGEIPASVTMKYKEKEIRCLKKTIIHFWNAGKKPICETDLSPKYIEIPFVEKTDVDSQILSISIHKNRPHIKISEPIVFEGTNIRFSFNFLEKGDKISITVLHTAQTIPSKVIGHVVGVPGDFVNVSEKQLEMKESIANVIYGSYDGLFSNLLSSLIKVLDSNTT